MASNVVRAFSGPPQPSQQGWVWNGTNWCWDPDDPCLCPPGSPPFPCPPAGFPTPCPPWFPPPAGQAPWYPGANGGVSFSATPPVNPIRGNFWWDGTMLHLFDGAAWVNIGPTSAVPGPGPGPSPSTSTITFAMPQPTDITGLGTTATAFTILGWTGTPLVNTQTGAYDPVSHKLTPTVAGLYEFGGRFPCFTGGGFAILKNDPGSYSWTASSVPVVVSVSETAGGFLQGQGLTQMNGTTDFVRMWAWAADGTFHNGGGNPMFSAVLLA